VADTPRDASVSTLVFRNDERGTRWEKDSLVAEEPLEIRLSEGGAEPERFVVTMRTPGDDDDLAVGLLYGEGVIEEIGEVVSIEAPQDTRVAPELAKNVRVVTLAPREGSSGEFVVPANVNLSAEQAGAFAQGRFYVIATSAANPNGEIRGQLAPDGVHVTFSELGASPEAAALGLRASGVAAATVDAHAGTLTVHVNTAGVEDATGARVVSGAGTALADLARSPVEMGHFSTELVRISASDVESFEAGRLSVSVAASSAPAGALRGAIGPDAATAGN